MSKFIRFFFLCLLGFVFVGNAEALSRAELVDLTRENRAVLLCEYVDSSGTVQNEIYHTFEYKEMENFKNQWTLTYMRFNNLTIGESTEGTFENVFVKNSAVSYNFHTGRMSASKELSFECPKHSFIDYDGVNEICFAEGPSCGMNFEKGPFTLTNNANTLFSVMDTMIKNAYVQITFDEYKSKTGLEELLKKKALAALEAKYQFNTTYNTPKYVDTYITKHAIMEKELNDLKERMKREEQKAINAGTLTETEKAELENKKNITYNTNEGSFVPSVTPSEGTDCNSILGNEMTEVVNNIFKTIQYAGPILVILLTAADILKVVLNGEMNEMKKISSKFMKRLIAAMLLFFVPLLCGIVFDVVGITVPDSCIGTMK